jgi:hypothetical protein
MYYSSGNLSLSLSLSLSLCKRRANPVFQGVMRGKYVRKSGQNSQSFYGLKYDVKVDICFYKSKIFSIPVQGNLHEKIILAQCLSYP